MKIKIENVDSTYQKESIEVINRCLSAVDGITKIEDAYKNIIEKIESVVMFTCGRGGSHIWVSNWNGERLIIITE